MSRAWILHGCTRHDLIGLFIDNEAFGRIDALDLVLSLLATDNEDLILCLNRRELKGQFISVAQLNALSSLTCQFVNVEFFGLLIEVVQTGSAWG